MSGLERWQIFGQTETMLHCKVHGINRNPFLYLSIHKQFLHNSKVPLTELLPTCVWRLCSMAMGFETSLVDEERGRGTCSSLELLLLIALQHKTISALKISFWELLIQHEDDRPQRDLIILTLTGEWQHTCCQQCLCPQSASRALPHRCTRSAPLPYRRSSQSVHSAGYSQATMHVMQQKQ
jgi:hypothetical protein